jgi:hypothetical protein
MNEWHDFFLAQAGLVFVGVSINLQKIVSDPSSGLGAGLIRSNEETARCRVDDLSGIMEA